MSEAEDKTHLRQTFFSFKGELETFEEPISPRELKKYNKSLLEIEKRRSQAGVCPYCLYWGTLDKFSILNQDKSLSKMLECPDCGATMRFRTTQHFFRGFEEYCKWYWDTIFSKEKYGEKRKIQHEKVKERVKILGFSDMFWQEYRRRKAERSNT